MFACMERELPKSTAIFDIIFRVVDIMKWKNIYEEMCANIECEL